MIVKVKHLYFQMSQRYALFYGKYTRASGISFPMKNTLHNLRAINQRKSYSNKLVLIARPEALYICIHSESFNKQLYLKS